MISFPSHDQQGRYPETIGVATEKPAWRDYWASMYDYYTVLGCEYEIKVCNPALDSYCDIVCGVQVDTYSAPATSTGNVMPLTRYSEALAYKNIKWYTSNNNSVYDVDRSNFTVIRGRYKPGDAKRNIVNDGDVKTWTATGTTLPTLTETLTANFWNNPWRPNVSNTGLNVEVNLKYIVQYKDLKQQARYPNTVTTAQDITIVLDETKTNNNGLQNW